MQFFVTDGFVTEDQKEEISSMINFKVKNAKNFVRDKFQDYFLVRIDSLTCYNKQFNIRSATARGKVEMLMLSLVTDKFPTHNTEKFFLKEAEAFIAFLRGQPNSELVFHIEKDIEDEEYQIVEQIFEETLQRLKDALDRFM